MAPVLVPQDRDLCHVQLHPTLFEPTSECRIVDNVTTILFLTSSSNSGRLLMQFCGRQSQFILMSFDISLQLPHLHHLGADDDWVALETGLSVMM